MPTAAAIVALIATYRRPKELRRLLDSIATLKSPLAKVIVVDNASSEEVRAIVDGAPFPTLYLDPGKNLGCAAGLRLAGERALALPQIQATHLLVLDDDAVLLPDSIERLLAAAAAEKADLAYPMVLDELGHVGWVPAIGISARALRRLGPMTPEEFRAKVTDRIRPFSFAQGVCLLISRDAVEQHGLHRDDFWVRGEDIEFTLRYTRDRLGIFVPDAVVRHLPPHGEAASFSREGEYLKHCAMVQNNAYLGFRLRHGWRTTWTMGGTLRHFFHLWGLKALPDALRALWRGAILGRPAGREAGPRTFYGRFTALMSLGKK
jgi:GT2 family glycosyltransferase